MQPVVIVDGNNLAQIKYGLQGSPVTIEIDRAVIRGLNAWAERQREPCLVDLILDPRMLHPDGARRVHVHVVLPGEKADARIRDHVRHCVLSRKPCVLISDDGELVAHGGRQGVFVIHVSEFIKFANFLNLPPACFEKNTYAYLSQGSAAVSAGLDVGDNTMRIAVNTQVREPSKKSAVPASNMLDVHERTLKEKLTGVVEDAPLAPASEFVKKQMARLNFDTWPLEDGFQFLTELICEPHKHEYQSLLGRPSGAVQADLLSYCQLVLELCGAEPDFYSRGGSLINKVRLLMLQSYPDGVDFALLEQTFKEYPGFQHKIRVHSGKSIELYEILQEQFLPHISPDQG